MELIILYLIRSIADIEANMQINLYGVVRVSQALLPLLRKGTGKQLVVLSSILGSIGGKTSETPVAATCEFHSSGLFWAEAQK